MPKPTRKELFYYANEVDSDLGVECVDYYDGLIVGMSSWHFYEIMLPKEDAVAMAKAILDHYSEKDNA